MKKLLYGFIIALLLVPNVALAFDAKADGTNLIANGSAEQATNTQPTGWYSNSWGTLSPTFTYENEGYDGSHSLKTTVTNRQDGDAKWAVNQVAVTPGKTYTYTDYYKANVDTEIDIAYHQTDGTTTYEYLEWISQSASWQQAEATFTVPANVTSVTILHIIAANGWLQIDAASLVEQDVATPEQPASLIANGSFETANGADPQGWARGGWGANVSTFSHINGDARTGNRSAQVTVSQISSGDVKWFAAPVAVNPGSTYIYEDYYKASTYSPVVVAFTDASGADHYQSLATAPAASTWTQYRSEITVPAGMTHLTVYHFIDSVGTLTLDDVSLIEAAIETPTDPSQTIQNPSFETANGAAPAGWSADSWGSNDADFAYVNGDARTGNRSAKVTLSNYVDGDAKWSFAPLTGLTPMQTYTYDIWYKTTVQPQAVMAYTDSAGEARYTNLGKPLPSAGAATSWQQYSTNFEVPAGATSVSILFVIAQNGWLQIDDASVLPYVPVGFNEAMVSLTFDDGWVSVYDNALPLLQEYDLVSTQYITSGFLNQPYYMTTAQVQAFMNSGSEIGAHTVSHANLTQISQADLNMELGQSKQTLQQLFGAGVAKNLATPYGAYNANVLATIPNYYSSHRSVDEGYNTKDSFNQNNIRVKNMFTTTTAADVAAWVAKAKADKAWLVLVYHNVTPTGDFDEHTVSTAGLDAQLAAVKASGVSVKTVEQALQAIRAQL